MYQILLVDDEPIILSGLQSMLKWEEMDCTVSGTARNGAQALEFIEQHHPQIVICDITMPILTGLELLSRVAERFPDIVFVMLTNHGQFDMALESLRHRAVDYLLKIDLDEQKLEHSVRLAMQESDKRQRLARVTAPDVSFEVSPAAIIIQHVSTLLGGSESAIDEAIDGLNQRGAASNCLLAELIMDPAHIPNIAAFTQDERSRLFDFHRKLAEDTAQKLFFQANFVLTARQPDLLLVYAWNLESSELMSRFQMKLQSALGNISHMQVSLLCTELLSGQELHGTRMQLVSLESEFHVSPSAIIHYSQTMNKTDYVNAAKRYVESHVLERISVQDAASTIGITPNYLSSLFKKQLGQNFMDYVNATKIEYACTLLRHNKHLVYEVSHMLGYDNAYYFSKVFKRYMGLTPTEYQNQRS